MALAVLSGLVAVFVPLAYWNADVLTGWAEGLVFALQTTNEPGITAGIVAVGGLAVGVFAIGGPAFSNRPREGIIWQTSCLPIPADLH